MTVSDASILIRDIAGDAAANAASSVKPSGDALNQIDEPARDNTWHDTPDISKDTLKNKVQSVYKGDPREDLQASAHAGTTQAHPSGANDPAGVARAAARDHQTGTSSGVNATGGAAAAANTLKQRVNENLDDDTKEAARSKAEAYRARTKEYFSKKMPEERREQTVWRLKVRPSNT